MRKLILRTRFALGDTVQFTAAVRDLHRCYPGTFLTDVRMPCGEIWNYNPYLSHLDENDPEVETIDCELPLINWSNKVPYHVLEGFIDDLNRQLGLCIRCTEFKGDLHLSPAEKRARSPVHELAGADLPYWLIVAGGRHEMTIKWWDTERYQAIVDHFAGRIQFVQAGGGSDFHPKLRGTIDLRGKTSIRELLRLMHHAQGVVCGVTGPMHLAAAVERKEPQAGHRPCVVVAGGRESPQWEAYPGHQFIHTVGALPCCAKGGCWKTRTVPLGDSAEDDDPEHHCVNVAGNLPRCMDMISAAEVIRRVETYFTGGVARYLTPTEARAGRHAVQRTLNNPLDAAPLLPANARYASERFLRSLPSSNTKDLGRGIVVCASGVAEFTSAWVCIRMLRQLGCALPIQVWHWGPHEVDAKMKSLLRPLGVECVDALVVRRKYPTTIARGPLLKPYALLHCPFAEALLLDPETVPVRNPEYVFSSRQFRASGAIAWPARPGREIPTLAWHRCGLEPKPGPVADASALFVNKTKCRKALALCVWYGENPEAYREPTRGGADAFHLAFHKTGVPFAMPARPEGETERARDFERRLLFQFRREQRWSLFFSERRVPGFRFEKECGAFLEDLRARWKNPGGRPRAFNPNSEAALRSARGSPDPQRVQHTGAVRKFPALASSQRAAALESRAPRALPTSEFGFHPALPPAATPVAARSAKRITPFTLVTLHDEKMSGVGAITAGALRDYARRNGYGFIHHERLLDPSRHPAWNKILALRKAVVKQKKGWVMWFDADAMVMNQQVRAESLLREDRDLIFASDFNGLVSGIFLVRCCAWTVKFLDTIFFLGDLIKDPDGFGPKWEQNTIKHVLENFAGFQSRVAILSPKAMNSSIHEFQPGDFVLHLGVMTNGERERAFREAARWMVK